MRYEKDFLIKMYEKLLLPRLIEERMLIALRQGKISKWFSSWGQEGISVGCAMAMKDHEIILTMHRNLGVFTTRDIPLERLFAQFQGKMSGFTKGRDRSFHFGTHEFKIVGMISHLGSQMGVADGIALANLLNKNNEVALVFSGDGGASEGDFHEAVNVAAVWQLPLIIVIENNYWGLSTPHYEQFKCKSFADKGIGYGIEAVSINGNDVLEVYETISRMRKMIQEKPQPVLVECNTFRMRGHEEASGTAYYPKGLIEHWEKFDPVTTFEQKLLDEGILNHEIITKTREHITKRIDECFKKALSEPHIKPNTSIELADVYAPFSNEEILPTKMEWEEKRFVDAISDGLREAMYRHPKLILMGQDIAEYGGVFKVTEGFVAEFGKERVRNTPLCEAAILGASLGLSIKGIPSMVEMQFADFVSEGFNQIVNNLAKAHYRWGQNAAVVVRMPTGAGVAAGPFHSQSNEAWFTHVPGLKVVYPAFPNDAKGLLLQSFEDPNPVLFFEHKKLYRSITGKVLKGFFTLPFGKARVLNEGEDLTIITYGWGVHQALNAITNFPSHSIEVIDLRTLIPLDEETIYASVKKTGKALILHEDTLTGGFGGELAARLAENCFEYLDAPVVRLGAIDTPVPFAETLEENFLPFGRMIEKIEFLLRY